MNHKESSNQGVGLGDWVTGGSAVGFGAPVLLKYMQNSNVRKKKKLKNKKYKTKKKRRKEENKN
jgi:hypothetical protein